MKLKVSKARVTICDVALLVTSIVLILLKAGGVINIAWWVCFIPVLLPILAVLSVFGVLLVGGVALVGVLLGGLFLLAVPVCVLCMLGMNFDDEDDFEEKLDKNLKGGNWFDKD